MQGAAYGLEAKSLSRLLSMGALDPAALGGGDGRAAEYVDLVTASDASLPPKDPKRKAAMHRMIARRPAFTAVSWLWPPPPGGAPQRGASAVVAGAGLPRVSVFRAEEGKHRNVQVMRVLDR